MRKWFIILILLAIFSIPMPSGAQGETKFASVNVDVWPEFDRPAVLVIYHLSLAVDVPLPVDLDLRIPAQAEVNAVAYTDASGTLVNATYDTKVEGSWIFLTFKTQSASVQIEYYDGLIKDAASRHIVYQWAGDYAVESLTVTLQQPVDATDLKFDPNLTKSHVEADGLTYHSSDPVTLAAGQAATWSMDYQKITDRLSSSSLNIQPSTPLGENTPGRVSFSIYMPWIIGGTGLLLIIAGLVVGLTYWRGTGKGFTPRKRHGKQNENSETTGNGTYCHQCGKRAQPEDVFCRTCGVRLRKVE